MEGGRKQTPSGSNYGSYGGGGSSTGSSISNELFGPKGSKPNSSSGIFDSVFSHPSSGNQYSRSEAIGSWRKKDSENQGWNPKHEFPGNGSQSNEGYGQGGYNKGRSSIFQDNNVEPHYLSSSIHYGGQDVYAPSAPRSSAPPHAYKKDGEEDDANGSNLHSASRGNWWQGGLYY